MFARGLKLTQEILNQVLITSYTTSALLLRRSMPQPYPNLVEDSSGKDASELLSLARQQLRFYHLSKGECMNLPVLIFKARPHERLCVSDDLPYAILFCQLQDVTWSTNRERYAFAIRSQPKEPLFTTKAITKGLDRGGSNAASLDDVPFSLLQGLPHCAMGPLLHYSKLLSLHEGALSNVILQIGIMKGGRNCIYSILIARSKWGLALVDSLRGLCMMMWSPVGRLWVRGVRVCFRIEKSCVLLTWLCPRGLQWRCHSRKLVNATLLMGMNQGHLTCRCATM